MAMELQPPDGRKRVKVYELRDNDWFDRGTGFCTGQVLDEIPRIFVESEDEPNRVLLETKILKDDGYQKQQGFCPTASAQLVSPTMKYVLTDLYHAIRDLDCMDGAERHGYGAELPRGRRMRGDLVRRFALPTLLRGPRNWATSPEIEQIVRAASMTQPGRDALSKFIIRDEYIGKLVPLVTMAEDLESLIDLHRLCNIMKSLILLNDNTIIETVVADQIILGVVGALEYDPEFPALKANHRQYLADQSRYKEVVPIRDPLIRRKIRSTWRLQYLKDVVLARILDDPTFSVLNSLIFFNQMEIVNHIQANAPFLRELFSVFDPRNADAKRKDDAVQFLHQCAAIAKNLQAPSRAQLFANFISHGLFAVIAFAVKHPNPAMRTTGIDILVALLDHDPVMMRGYMLKAVNEKKTPLTDTLIDLLHAETDLGVKNQLADAIKILLDPQIPLQDPLGRAGPDYFKLRSSNLLSDAFVQQHFDESSKRIFQPLKQLADRESLDDLTFQEVTLYAHLVDILTFFVRQHLFRTRNSIQSESLAPRVAQLLTAPQKHLKLVALKFFRTLISLQDTFYQALMTRNNTFGLILDIVLETMPRDNLLNSACLELFEFIKRENIKPFILHVVEKYREKLEQITYVDTFQSLCIRFEQLQGYEAEADSTLFSQEEASSARRIPLNGQRWQGVKGLDADEERYFEAGDDDDEDEWTTQDDRGSLAVGTPNGSSPLMVKPLVDYPDDDDDEDTMDTTKPDDVANHAQSEPLSVADVEEEAGSNPPSPAQTPPAPERLAEKRRRDDEDEDELVKLAAGPKRRSSTSSNSSAGILNRKKNLSIGSTGSEKSAGNLSGIASAAPKRIAINLGPAKTATTEADKSCTEVSTDGNEKENRDDSQGDEDG
ncbi:hypothetical protein N7509_011143 [Penicillium cosmopolitanum]|uniref:Serine/threonine-protein phosphatase 4 regulatory subunit 3-like central domain-containing protein n=1 Tax=Penicillium cosmopolitanum TaxID=1131564 RepID=A0A9W9VSI3_9EURO|nr:uncharacterized protein N7509_011143 [Penicillium cosmopolitanum]KAJ5388602.1 hypothetical protein N7509_011143 [Penicillium cosmopolitanum]